MAKTNAFNDKEEINSTKKEVIVLLQRHSRTSLKIRRWNLIRIKAKVSSKILLKFITLFALNVKKIRSYQIGMPFA